MTTCAVIETRPGDSRAVIRLSADPGLLHRDDPDILSPAGQELRLQILRQAHVAEVRIIRAETPGKCNIVVHWDPGADGASVSQQAWGMVLLHVPHIELSRAFWEG
jgi:hypothetical protein